VTLHEEIMEARKEKNAWRTMRVLYEIAFFSAGFFTASALAYIISFYA
jgi:hypothetical protein